MALMASRYAVRSVARNLRRTLLEESAVVAAVWAPSCLEVEFARWSGQTVVGFLRGDRMNVYSHPERIVFDG